MKKAEIIRPTVRKRDFAFSHLLPITVLQLQSAQSRVLLWGMSSHIMKWLKTWLFLAMCPPKVKVPIREAGQSCGPDISFTVQNHFALAESMLQLRPPACNCRSWGVGRHSSTIAVPAVRPGHKIQAEVFESSEGVWALYESTDVSFSACSSEIVELLQFGNILMLHLVKSPSRSTYKSKQQQKCVQPCMKAVTYCQ